MMRKTPKDSVKVAGLMAMLGSALGIAMSPVLVYLWTTYSEAYAAFGRAYFLVYLGCIAGLLGLGTRRKANFNRPGAEKLGIGTILVGLAVALVGDLLGGTPNADGFTDVQAGGFFLEMLGLFILLLGSVSLGDIYLRANVPPRWFAWLPVLFGPGGILLSALHVPSGTMLLFCLAWVGMGYVLWSQEAAAFKTVGAVR